jgi:predicted DNA-binding protein (UPF0251 family)
MVEQDRGECRRHRRGRPRVRRMIEDGAVFRCYAPVCPPGGEGRTVILLPEELEILRLVDLQGLGQEEAAAILGVSRKTAWRDLHEARRKVADALVNGKRIEVAGCKRRDESVCPRREENAGPETI